MEEDKNNKLVRRPGSDLSKPGRPVNRVREGMTRDVLARAKAQDLSAARFRIGEYLLREPDYRQILRWAEAGGMRPEEILQRLAESVVELPYWAEPTVGPIRFSIEDGAMVSVPWDFDLLPFIPISWEPGILIRELGFKEAWLDAAIDLCPNLSILKKLVCNSANLEVLDLSKVPQLTELFCLGNCWGNNLPKLNLIPVPRLCVLNCRGNNLTELDLTPLPGLTKLNCAGNNNLSELDLTPVARLTELSCGGTNLTKLELTAVRGLTKLDFSEMMLTELDLTPVPKLTDLDIELNDISELDLTPVPGLKMLNCSDNSLSELDLTPVPRLTILYCGNDHLSELDLTPVPRLTGLDCRYSNLTELDLAPVARLKELFCDKEVLVRNAPAGLVIKHRNGYYLSRR